MKTSFTYAFAAIALTLGTSAVHAQESAPPATGQMDHGQMDHSQMDHGQMKGAGSRDKAANTDSMKPGTDSMDHGAIPEEEAPRDPHAYSGGYDLGPLKLQLDDEHSTGSLLMDKLEAVRNDGNTAAAYDLQAWYGRTYDRAVLKAEGEVADGEFDEARTELLWSHAVAPFWDAQLGLRHDAGEGPNRNWLTFGVQGLAPYWFEIETTGYVGEEGRSALRVQASYELLLTQKLVLQPSIEANLYGKRDAERALGSGLSDLAAGLRLRYEIWREFAPYLGIERLAKFGETEDFVRAGGKDAQETRVVAGLRFWF